MNFWCDYEDDFTNKIFYFRKNEHEPLVKTGGFCFVIYRSSFAPLESLLIFNSPDRSGNPLTLFQ
jgi:hypothetical protein